MPEHTGREDLTTAPAAAGPTPPSGAQSDTQSGKPVQAPSPERSAARPAQRPAPPTPRLDHLPPFKVLLHNDDANDMGFVVQSLIELTPLRLPAAVKVMECAHEEGVALVLVTHRERAELYCEQFATKGLCATTEPA